MSEANDELKLTHDARGNTGEVFPFSSRYSKMEKAHIKQKTRQEASNMQTANSKQQQPPRTRNNNDHRGILPLL
jgi:hypothetical protein